MFTGETLYTGPSLEGIDGDELVSKLGSMPLENRLKEAVKHVMDSITARKPQ